MLTKQDNVFETVARTFWIPASRVTMEPYSRMVRQAQERPSQLREVLSATPTEELFPDRSPTFSATSRNTLTSASRWAFLTLRSTKRRGTIYLMKTTPPRIFLTCPRLAWERTDQASSSLLTFPCTELITRKTHLTFYLLVIRTVLFRRHPRMMHRLVHIVSSSSRLMLPSLAQTWQPRPSYIWSISQVPSVSSSSTWKEKSWPNKSKQLSKKPNRSIQVSSSSS